MGVAEILLKRKQELASKNLIAGEEFRSVNGTNQNVTTLASGLQFEVISMGSGEKPTENSTVECHYHGYNIGGEVFDSSVQRNKTATFALNRVIKGWTEGVQLMPIGSKFKFVIPPHLAYGEEQLSKEIGPNSTLIFEVELINIL